MEFLIPYAISFSGVPYKYGGDNPITGFDCSGYVQWLLRACGIDPVGRQNAQQLFNIFEPTSTQNSFQAGALSFYGKDVTHIEHIGFIIDPYRMMECGGGDHTTLTVADAAMKNACVRMSLIRSRQDFLTTLKPQYSKIGLI